MYHAQFRRQKALRTRAPPQPHLQLQPMRRHPQWRRHRLPQKHRSWVQYHPGQPHLATSKWLRIQADQTRVWCCKSVWKQSRTGSRMCDNCVPTRAAAMHDSRVSFVVSDPSINQSGGVIVTPHAPSDTPTCTAHSARSGFRPFAKLQRASTPKRKVVRVHSSLVSSGRPRQSSVSLTMAWKDGSRFLIASGVKWGNGPKVRRQCGTVGCNQPNRAS